MKVAYVLRYYPTLSETFVVREIAELVRRGVEVVIAAIGERADGALADGLPDVPVRRPTISDTVRGALTLEDRSLGEPLRRRDVARAVALGRWCRATGVERLHAHFVGEASAWARIAASVAGIPFSVTAHAVDLYKPWPLAATHLRDARPAVVVSIAGASRIEALAGVVPRVVRCGVLLPPVAVGAPPPSDALRVVTVARWTPKKGLDRLVDVVADHPWLQLRLVCDAPVAADRVTTGALAPSAVYGELARHDVFVLPSRVAPDGDRDGVPVALMEAMAVGLPVIATRVGGIAELVDDEVGWLVPPNDRDSLVRALVEARLPSERRRRGRAARRRIRDEGWTVTRQVDELLAAWEHPCSAR